MKRLRYVRAEKEVVRGYLVASFTIEATLVLLVVFFTLAATIKHAYYLHDTITGNMIFEESLEQARYYVGKEDGAEGRDATIKTKGEQKGNPRLLLGDYRLDIERITGKIKGSAKAGDWNNQIEIGLFQPGTFLRRYQALSTLGEKLSSDER